MPEGLKHISTDVPESIYDEIVRLAQEEERSMRRQIVVLLREALVARREAKQQEEEIQAPRLVAA